MTIVHVPSGEVVQEGRAVTLACKGGKEGWWRRYAYASRPQAINLEVWQWMGNRSDLSFQDDDPAVCCLVITNPPAVDRLCVTNGAEKQSAFVWQA